MINTKVKQCFCTFFTQLVVATYGDVHVKKIRLRDCSERGMNVARE